jgi:hypothetical protein
VPPVSGGQVYSLLSVFKGIRDVLRNSPRKRDTAAALGTTSFFLGIHWGNYDPELRFGKVAKMIA